MDLVLFGVRYYEGRKEGNGRIHSLVNSYSFEIEKSRLGRLIPTQQQ
jgi:hypothetical protein